MFQRHGILRTTPTPGIPYISSTKSHPFPTSSNPRLARRLSLIVGLVIFSALFSILDFAVAETARATSSFVLAKLGNIAPNHTKCDSRCPVDPFTRPGMLIHGNNSEARWLPFPRLTHAQQLKSRDIRYNASVPLGQGCPQYMRMLTESNGTSTMDWARNKTVLFIGSSHDRNNIEYFCEEVRGMYSSIGGHLAASCNIPSHNLVLALWFTFGAVDSESYDWFSQKDHRPLTFERKIQEVMLPWMARHHIGRPDIIIESSLFWDDKFFSQRSRYLNDASRANQPLTYPELIWHRSRIHALVTYTRKLYGLDVPIMFRTRHIRKSNSGNRIMRIFQLDQSLRAAALDLDVKLFTWGDKLEGMTSFYDDDQHFRRGPVTWLFGDMTLFYLKQATTPGCWKCSHVQH